jgi:hypothetical protein
MKIAFLKEMGFLLMVGVLFSQCTHYPHYKTDQTYLYQYTRKGVEIGTEVFSMGKKGRYLLLKADINIGEANSHQRGNSELVFRKDGKAVAYHRYLDVKLPDIPDQSGSWELKYAFRGGRITGEVTKDGSVQWKGTIEMREQGVYCIDNNALSLRKEEEYSVRAFHFSEASVRRINFRKVKEDVYRFRIGIRDVGTLSIRDGTLIKYEDPARDLVVRLKR